MKLILSLILIAALPLMGAVSTGPNSGGGAGGGATNAVTRINATTQQTQTLTLTMTGTVWAVTDAVSGTTAIHNFNVPGQLTNWAKMSTNYLASAIAVKADTNSPTIWGPTMYDPVLILLSNDAPVNYLGQSADGVVYKVANPGAGSQTPWAANIAGAGYQLSGVGMARVNTNHMGYAVITNGVDLGTSPTVSARGAPTNSVPITNLLGLVHLSSASVLAIDASQSHHWSVTNPVTGATSLVVTNTADGQELSIYVKGEVAAGAARDVTLIAHTGQLIVDEDDPSVAPATSSTFSLTNGYTAEIRIAVRRLNGTNTLGKVHQQFKF
jgi:hypothetical protein